MALRRETQIQRFFFDETKKEEDDERKTFETNEVKILDKALQ